MVKHISVSKHNSGRSNAKSASATLTVPLAKNCSVLMSSDELYVLIYSVTLAKIIGEQPISNRRQREFKVLATRPTGAKVKIRSSELKILVAHYETVIINGIDEVASRLKFLQGHIDVVAANKIRKLVTEYELLKDLHENEGSEDDWDFPEDDFDTYRGR
ncbi:MAG: hypothetical protein ACLQQ4_01660 [Bacteroidia bacterium]